MTGPSDLRYNVNDDWFQFSHNSLVEKSDTVDVTTAKSDHSVDGMYDAVESNDVGVNDCGIVCHSDNLDDAVAKFFIFLATGLIRTLLREILHCIHHLGFDVAMKTDITE